jgi:hypothetical protein
LLVVKTAGAQMPLPAAVMAYRQSKRETRAAIIAYLKEMN